MSKRCEFCAMTRTAPAARSGAALILGMLPSNGLLLLTAP